MTAKEFFMVRHSSKRDVDVAKRFGNLCGSDDFLRLSVQSAFISALAFAHSRAALIKSQVPFDAPAPQANLKTTQE
jgi:hypothetical protein